MPHVLKARVILHTHHGVFRSWRAPFVPVCTSIIVIIVIVTPVLARKILRVVQTVGDLAEVFAGNPEPAEVAAFADGHDHSPCLDRFRMIPGKIDLHSVAA